VKEFVNTANINSPAVSVRFLSVHRDGNVPFPDDYFDLIYTKKGPELSLFPEVNRITKPGGLVIGLYFGGTDGGFRNLFPGLYHPMAVDPFDLEFLANKWEINKSDLTDFNIEVIEEIEYLSKPEDVLIKKCFGQNKVLKEVA
jgi:SAM-dependent methyltransferase